MSKFNVGDIVKVVRVKSNNRNEYTYGTHYPKLGWEGILERSYAFGTGEWVIKWTNPTYSVTGGDLIREWMLIDPEPKSIKLFGIAKFCKEMYV